MNEWQRNLVIIFFILNLASLIKGYWESRYNKNPLGTTFFLTPLGIFVWADAIIIGSFWVFTSVASLIIGDWILFLIFYSVFWVVRSLGETIYWLNQQFSDVRTNPRKNLPLYKVLKIEDDYTIWFLYQVMNQCITVVSIITSVYLFNLWLR